MIYDGKNGTGTGTTGVGQEGDLKLSGIQYTYVLVPPRAVSYRRLDDELSKSRVLLHGLVFCLTRAGDNTENIMHVLFSPSKLLPSDSGPLGITIDFQRLSDEPVKNFQFHFLFFPVELDTYM